MKTKIALAVALVALFVAVPSATSKGPKTPPASVGATIGCSENDGDAGVLDSDTDTCIVSFTSLNAGTTYDLRIDDPCSGNLIITQLSGSSNYTFTFDFVRDCGTSLTISLSTGIGRKATAVPITVTGDTGAV